jgi:hypothetical protein
MIPHPTYHERVQAALDAFGAASPSLDRLCGQHRHVALTSDARRAFTLAYTNMAETFDPENWRAAS